MNARIAALGTLAALALVVIFAAPNTAFAQRPADRPGGYDYEEGEGSFDEYVHKGFFLRINPGFGFGFAFSPEHDDNNTLALGSKTSYKLYGMTFAFDTSVGGVVTDNLALALTFSGNVFIEPTWKTEVKVGGTTEESTFDIEDKTYAAFLVGPSLTYWFDPSNVYISFSTGPAFLVRAEKSKAGSSGSPITLGRAKVGAGAMLQIGKEWWVARHFGLGVSLKLDFAWNPDKQDRHWFTSGAAIMFSASFN